jgi:hypothetical protein
VVQEPADRGHQLLGSVVLLGFLGADYAVLGMVLEQLERNLVKSGFDRILLRVC